MKFLKTLLLFIFIKHTLSAQKKAVNEFASVDNKALQIPASLTKTTDNISGYVTANFKTDKEKTRAIFIWIATNIRYDVENMYAIDFYGKKEDKILTALKTRKGICEDYAFLFNDICIKSGIKSFVIEGYTKQNGVVDNLSHAWCAALVDGSWFLFDPTWGSGYTNGGKYYKKINNYYYKTNPESIIKSHMPFDYLWQFANYTVTNQEFYDGKTQQNKSKPYFNFLESIGVYEKQNHIEQLTASSQRIEKNGMKNSLIYDRLQHLKLEIENYRQTKDVNSYNAAVGDYNDGINNLNEFIQYRNKQFIPQKPDQEVLEVINSADSKLAEAKVKLGQIDKPDLNTVTLINQLSKSIADASIQVAEQQDWLKTYFSKGKSGRKSMFFSKKVTWFGLPLN